MPHVPGHRSWDEAGPSYRQDWEGRAGTSGGRWEEVEPGYRYGHEMAGDSRYEGRQWSDTESELRTGYRDWSRQQGYRHDDDGDNAWEKIKDSVREAWDKVRGR